MENATSLYYEKRGQILVQNLRRRHFDAWYCATASEAREKALELIPEGASVGWGGALSASQIGLIQSLKEGRYAVLDRDATSSPEERGAVMRRCFDADCFITGANALSLDGQMVNIDGVGNRVGLIVYGPEHVIVIAGMNKVCDSLDAALVRARKVAAPMNQQRFLGSAPCSATGSCSDCISDGCICNQVLVTRNCRPAGRIKFIIVGQDLGF